MFLSSMKVTIVALDILKIAGMKFFLPLESLLFINNKGVLISLTNFP